MGLTLAATYTYHVNAALRQTGTATEVKRLERACVFKVRSLTWYTTTRRLAGCVVRLCKGMD